MTRKKVILIKRLQNVTQERVNQLFTSKGPKSLNEKPGRRLPTKAELERDCNIWQSVWKTTHSSDVHGGPQNLLGI